MKRKFIFLKGDTEIVLPVTPPSIETSSGIKIETVNIHGMGDIRIAGYRTLANITIAGFFPAREYDFIEAGAEIDPYRYVKRFKAIIVARKPVRLIITGTEINHLVLIEELRYSERDGTNDVDYTMTLSEYEYTDAVSTVGEGGKTRPEDTAPTPPKTYTVVYGDTLWSIARRFLGKGSLYTLIAKVNNMPDPNILRVGQVLVIPEVP